MNKKELAQKVANQVGITKSKAEQVIDSTLNSITESLVNQEKVRLVGFGNFVVRTRAGRIGRNPQTGQKIDISSSKSPAFVPGFNLKKAVKNKSTITP
ncbi:DNA-binding protein HU [candidate division WOR-1 bacterium RIFOXYD2_FULL_36_8]|uniref:DNA-binding protein HU n=1 Tax=candidate division WOR-1 bacterium RIFOXYB2_FULL_36_35 TaxID=1802578 RepID=A0A1F4S5L4_UNCSA|nr:MAG: DNA-binding protein HU [candidate division WOR-1 bacterium RIFOXYA2_FULL_36_21]OGC15728.1 MAG: DNA-binding protein HU [candidate division WOR-1 bacterium RIFOXYB2_FULL_36_35]OGC21083.1 MAG: DNA-binding protein HU [candidate division WOR-1 bacterium RIFOXYA12_FULL_36_13]OGC41263.1 MAG: DNA-binding protein HU [candidate division WOR-1 bacterium RIFOXYD2_FULL_36_8]